MTVPKAFSASNASTRATNPTTSAASSSYEGSGGSGADTTPMIGDQGSKIEPDTPSPTTNSPPRIKALRRPSSARPVNGHPLSSLDECRHLPARPMRQPGLGRRTRASHRQDLRTHSRRNLLTRRRVRPFDQSSNPLLSIAAKPQIHRGTRYSRQRGDLLLHPAFRAPRHNPSSRRNSR